MLVRPAKSDDAEAMSRVLKDIIAATGRERAHDVADVLQRYVEHADRVECSVAVDVNGDIVGFQSLRLAKPGNPYDVTPGWGIIGTHVSPRAHRQGAGRALFAATLAAARNSGIRHVDATIGADNPQALAYYDAIGFRSYRYGDTTICKRLDIE